MFVFYFFDRRKSKGGGFAPAFKPIGQTNTQTGLGEWTTIGTSFTMAKPVVAESTKIGVKRSKESEESQAKIAEKKARLAKFGLKFQSAGTLVTIGDQLGRDSSIYRTPAVIQRLGGTDDNDIGKQFAISNSSQFTNSSKSQTDKQEKGSKDSSSGSEKKLSFGFQKSQSRLKQQQLSVAKGSRSDAEGGQPKGVYTSTWEKPGSSQEKSESSQKDKEKMKGPPPKLMSRQRELTLERAFNAESDDEDDSLATLQQLAVRSQPKFRFNIKK